MEWHRLVSPAHHPYLHEEENQQRISTYMEKIDELLCWLEQMIVDAQEKLNISDETLSYVLMERALRHYIRAIAQKQLKKAG